MILYGSIAYAALAILTIGYFLVRRAGISDNTGDA